MFSKQLQIKQTWNGQPALAAEEGSVFIRLDHEGLHVHVQAPFHHDPPPPSPSGLTPGLWEYELVELFLLGGGGQYLEIELGPHGHYLVYFLKGVRQVARSVAPLRVACVITSSRWQGDIVLSRADLPDGLSHVNGYALHGQGVQRRYLAAAPVPGPAPDFHQPRAFLPLEGLMDWSVS
ncbi:MAG: hypothetical protein PF442_09400 [Desulfobulbaceae bacterium]|jgi:hypothetical protein|nr:hypothetical protein [Desulfobulbaceae bacterium]